ncbi:MAG: type I polyketide synthase, partial [Bacteroidota bacterium]
DLSRKRQQAVNNIKGAEYHICDVSNKEEVIALIQKIKVRHRKLNGIIHSAGVIKDNFIQKKTEKEALAVLAPKIEGAKYLDEATRNENLDFMIYFSSVAGLFGNTGQSDYASANAFLDNYALYRNELVAKGKRQGHTLSINWPLWEQGGMQTDDETRQHFKKKWGLHALPNEEGLAAFEKLLGTGVSQGIVVYGEENKLSRALLNKNEPVDEEEQTAADHGLQQIVHVVLGICADLLMLDRSDLETDVHLSEYGVDSIMMIKLLNAFEEHFNIVADPTAIVNYPTVALLAHYIKSETAALAKENKEVVAGRQSLLSSQRTRLRKSTTLNSGRVAIIGMSCKLPQSDDLEAYWRNLKAGRNLISDTPPDRWDASKHYSKELLPDKTYTTKGGFVNNPGFFDAKYFNVGDAAAVTMDPQQRLTLELTRSLLANAGYRKEELKATKTSTYIGAKDNNYGRNFYHLLPEGAFQHVMVNNISNMIAARVSDFYDLRGESKVIDTACSSSLVAIHEACENIAAGKVDLAIAGGITILTDAFMHISLSQAGVLSRDGKSYVFDERANGFVLGEGGGLVLLKDYQKALADGDRILGVIAGSAVNNDGNTMGLTVPNMEGQKAVIKEALARAGISPAEISYYEAHGTGTLLGDPIEVKAATEVYRSITGGNVKKQYCAIGSAKSNLGHTMMAAGVTGLIKILLQMQHNLIVPTLHCERPHPRFQFEQSPFYPNTELREWKRDKKIAAISSFGFGGTNSHMVIEKPADGNLDVLRSPLPIERLSRKYYWPGYEMKEFASAGQNGKKKI